MKPDNLDRCGDCRFFHSAYADGSQLKGICGRHAPRPILAGQADPDWDEPGNVIRPRAWADGWCGEFELGDAYPPPDDDDE